MAPREASNAAGLILAPFFLISAMQVGRWLIDWLTIYLTGGLT